MKPSVKATPEILDNWHNDPKNWKMGLFYFNKLDKRIFPPKRIQGMGWTVNFANPWSILSILGIIALFLLLIKYFR